MCQIANLSRQRGNFHLCVFILPLLIESPHAGSGLTINKKTQLQFCDKIQNLFAVSQNFSRKIVTLHCVVSVLAKKYMTPQYDDGKKVVVNVTSQLNYTTITLSSDGKKIHSEKQN